MKFDCVLIFSGIHREDIYNVDCPAFLVNCVLDGYTSQILRTHIVTVNPDTISQYFSGHIALHNKWVKWSHYPE